MSIRSVVFVSMLAGAPGALQAQAMSEWTFVGRGIVRAPYLGQDAIRIHAGSAYQPGVSFENGTIEFDMAPVARRSFLGVMFRMRSPDDYEDIYFRPSNFGNWDAMQYAPVYNRSSTWQLYHGPGHSAAVSAPYDAWTHVRIVVKGSRATVYVGATTSPALEVRLRRGPGAGAVGFWAYDFLRDTTAYGGTFANLRVTPDPAPVLFDSVATADARHYLVDWSLSNPILDTARLRPEDVVKRASQVVTWSRVRAEDNGVVDLNRALTTPPDARRAYAIARIRIHSDQAQIKKLAFGYSDDIVVLLNSLVVYSGVNGYNSRFPDYLGLVSADFDVLHLPLRAGVNELLVAVSDDMQFGWGFAARLDDRSGIRVLP